MSQEPEPVTTTSEDELEKTLLQAWADARARQDKVSADLKVIDAAVDAAETKLIEFMRDRETKSTAKYAGIGFATIEEPKLFARCNKPFEAQLFTFLKEAKHEEIIKPSVHHANLTAIVRELMEEGKQIPEFINYGFTQSLKLYRRP